MAHISSITLISVLHLVTLTAVAARMEGPAVFGILGLVIVGGGWLVLRATGKVGGGVDKELRKSKLNPEEVCASMPPRPAEAQDVDVTVFAPPMVPPGEEVIVQVIFHTPEREAEAAVRAQRVDTAAAPLASIPLTIQVRKDDEIRATLECDEAKIAEPVQYINWNGRLGYCYFTLKLPPDAKGITRPRLRVFVNGVPAGRLIFQFQVKAKSPDVPPAPANQSVKSFRKPFLSYASQDRVHVLKAAQLLDALNMKYFQDVLSLSPGERWEKRLYEEIKSCDVFLLFWSQNARASEWVIREAEYALQYSATAPAQDGIEIVPVLLEGPPAPLPPASLGAIHFNDPIRHIIFAEENVANARTLVECEALDRLGENIERLFRTPRGPIAQMKDGTAIARVDKEFKRFTSVFEYRTQSMDGAEWPELTTKEAKRQFCTEAADILRTVQGDRTA